VDQEKIQVLADLIPSVKREGEDGYFAFPLLSGYQFCRAHVDVLSTVPASGDRASVLSIATGSNGPGAYTWTPKRHWTEGRSWVEFRLQVTSVREDLLANALKNGDCKSPAMIIDCKGTACVPGPAAN
jgi:hypothetical protein